MPTINHINHSQDYHTFKSKDQLNCKNSETELHFGQKTAPVKYILPLSALLVASLGIGTALMPQAKAQDSKIKSTSISQQENKKQESIFLSVKCSNDIYAKRIDGSLLLGENHKKLNIRIKKDGKVIISLNGKTETLNLLKILDDISTKASLTANDTGTGTRIMKISYKDKRMELKIKKAKDSTNISGNLHGISEKDAIALLLYTLNSTY